MNQLFVPQSWFDHLEKFRLKHIILEFVVHHHPPPFRLAFTTSLAIVFTLPPKIIISRFALTKSDFVSVPIKQFRTLRHTSRFKHFTRCNKTLPIIPSPLRRRSFGLSCNPPLSSSGGGRIAGRPKRTFAQESNNP